MERKVCRAIEQSEMAHELPASGVPLVYIHSFATQTLRRK